MSVPRIILIRGFCCINKAALLLITKIFLFDILLKKEKWRKKK